MATPVNNAVNVERRTFISTDSIDGFIENNMGTKLEIIGNIAVFKICNVIKCLIFIAFLYNFG